MLLFQWPGLPSLIKFLGASHKNSGFVLMCSGKGIPE